MKKPFGKMSLLGLLRQLSKLHSEKRSISVGLVGYPNVGKSSIINSLKQQKVVNVAPVPGETKVWQYISLTKRIYLIDSPGVVYKPESIYQQVLKGCIRPEKIEDPEVYIPAILDKIKPEVLAKTH